MKKLLLLLAIFVFVFKINAQNNTKIIELVNLDKQQIAELSAQWAGETFNSAKSVIQSNTVSSTVIKAGEHMGSPFFNVFAAGMVNYTVLIKYKDNKAKIEVKGFTHISDYSGKYPKYSFGNITNTFNPENRPTGMTSPWTKSKYSKMHGVLVNKKKRIIKNIIYSYKTYMNNDIKTSDW